MLVDSKHSHRNKTLYNNEVPVPDAEAQLDILLSLEEVGAAGPV